MDPAASLWVKTDNRVVCGVMVNTSGGCRGRGGCRLSGTVFTVTVAEGRDRVAQSRFQTVRHQHDLGPSPVRT
jgi:hypothetical protein